MTDGDRVRLAKEAYQRWLRADENIAGRQTKYGSHAALEAQRYAIARDCIEAMIVELVLPPDEDA